MVLVPPGMTLWRRWIHRPQNLAIRKLLFQVHLWLGIGVGLYVTVISVSGSALVYSREIAGKRLHRTVEVPSNGRTRLRTFELRRRVEHACPSCEVLSIVEPQRADQAEAVVLQRGEKRFERLFDPYTGADLGDPLSPVDRAIGWFADLHDNLLSGLTGRTLNGVGSLLLVFLALTGAVIWWPGVKNWRRSTTINWRARFARVNWDLHSAIGFWCYLFVLIWGISGICLCFPGVLDFLFSNEFRLWITRLHFGRFNLVTEILWTALGLAPAVLAVTGALMWWNRVLRKKLRRSSLDASVRSS
ncbi:MAG TPA: PepSY-associated TM helix domain-containing protein [Bryobacteraceae bacterium]|nr:PepSY-associated TM helix domain-containing protein [Bryobacteraceae bacterium]